MNAFPVVEGLLKVLERQLLMGDFDTCMTVLTREMKVYLTHHLTDDLAPYLTQPFYDCS